MESLRKIVMFFATPGFWLAAGSTLVVIATFQFYASPFGKGQIVTEQLPGLAIMSLGAFLGFYLVGWSRFRTNWPHLRRSRQEQELWNPHPSNRQLHDEIAEYLRSENKNIKKR